MADLYEQIRAAGTARETKADIIDYFKEKYPDVRTNSKGQTIEAWKSKAADALQVFVPDVKRASLMRRFQGNRIPQGNNLPEYAALGEMLPTIPPENGYEISGTIWVKFSDGECEEREIDPPEYITGDDAKALSEAAYREALTMIANEYMEDPFDQEEGNGNYTIGDCQPPDLIVSAKE